MKKWFAVGLLAATLTWQDNSDNENGFVIERAVDCINYEVLGYVGVNVETFQDSLPVDQACYRVGAYNEVDIAYSNVAQYLAPVVQPPKKCKGRKCK